MITSEPPYKLADIIRDTWPQLYRPLSQNNDKINNYKKETNYEDIPRIS